MLVNISVGYVDIADLSPRDTAMTVLRLIGKFIRC